MANQYEHKEAVGLIESVTPNQTSNGKSFFDVVVNGNTYNIWESFIAQQAEAYQQGGVPVKVALRAKVQESGRPSKFWTVTGLEPVGAPQAAPGAEAAATPSPTAIKYPSPPMAPATGKGESKRGADVNRSQLLDIAVKALATSDSLHDPNTVIAYAKQLEDFILGNND